MKKNCIFCKIVNKEIASKIIFEDEKCMAILDINPISPGHLVLFPKEHFMIMQAVPDDILGHLAFVSKSLCELLIKTFECLDVTSMVCNGTAAGQMGQHYLIHLIPKYKNDNLDFSTKANTEQKDFELEKLQTKLKEKLFEMNSKV